MSFYKKDAQNNWVQVQKLVPIPGEVLPKNIKTGEWALDGDKTTAYYEATGTSCVTANSITMMDLPGPQKALTTETAKSYSKVEMEFETYLVYNKKFYYKLTWSRTFSFANGEWSSNYGKVRSFPLDGLNPGEVKGNANGKVLFGYYINVKTLKYEPYYFDLGKLK